MDFILLLKINQNNKCTGNGLNDKNKTDWHMAMTLDDAHWILSKHVTRNPDIDPWFQHLLWAYLIAYVTWNDYVA